MHLFPASRNLHTCGYAVFGVILLWLCIGAPLGSFYGQIEITWCKICFTSFLVHHKHSRSDAYLQGFEKGGAKMEQAWSLLCGRMVGHSHCISCRFVNVRPKPFFFRGGWQQKYMHFFKKEKRNAMSVFAYPF